MLCLAPTHPIQSTPNLKVIKVDFLISASHTGKKKISFF